MLENISPEKSLPEESAQLTSTTHPSVEISLVPSSEIENIWDKVSHMLKRSTDLSRGRYRLRDLKAKLVSGEFNLWIVFQMGGPDQGKILAAITSSFMDYPQGKMLSGQFLGGDRLEEWRDKFCAVFDRWAKDTGCKAIEFTGRAGWGKVLAGNGYKEAFRIYQRDLD